MTHLRCRMIEDLQVRNYARATQENYVRYVARFAQHFGRSPDQLGPEEVRAFQVYLVNEADPAAFVPLVVGENVLAA